MDWSLTQKYLAQPESDTLRFIGDIENENQIGPYITAMANSGGGRLFVGLDRKNYHLTGTWIDGKWVNNVSTAYISPSLTINTKEVCKANKTILYILISEGNSKPYAFKGVFYMMDNGLPRPCNEDELNKFNPLPGQHQPKSTQLPAPTQTKTSSRPQPIEPSEQPQETVIQEEIDTTSPSAMFKERIVQKELNFRQKEALSVIRKDGVIKNKTYREMFNISHKTAHLELVDLVERNYIHSQGQGRSTCYVLNT